MLSLATTAVAAPATVMWTPKQVAERDRVTRQAVTKKVRQLATLGLTVERDGQAKIVRFNVVEYDRLRGRFDDPSKAQWVPPERVEADASETYQEALRQKTWHEAERRRLEVEEIKGALLRADRVREAVRAAFGETVGVMERMVNAADDLAAAAALDGAHGVRAVLKKIVAAQRSEVAAALTALAEAAPTLDVADEFGPRAAAE